MMEKYEHNLVVSSRDFDREWHKFPNICLVGVATRGLVFEERDEISQYCKVAWILRIKVYYLQVGWIKISVQCSETEEYQE